MPLPGVVLTSSDSYSGGREYTRFKGPILSGSIQSNPSVLDAPGGVMCVQSTAVLATQIITTTAQPARSAFVYIPQGTVGVTSSNTANVAADPPYTGSGAALYFDYTRKKLSIWSSGVGDWLSVTLSSS